MLHTTDRLLVERVRRGEGAAWQDLIARYEGRLLAFLARRVPRLELAEDLVQETFIGFLTSLPNYDDKRSLEGYLISIATHKLTDSLRRAGRRPTIPLASSDSSSQGDQLPARNRAVSSLFRSNEQNKLERHALLSALQEQLATWRERNEWEKIQVAELICVRGWPNKDIARTLKISEQRVANLKYEFIQKLRGTLERQGLLPDELLPAAD